MQKVLKLSVVNGHRAFVLIGGVAALTLVINATTAKKILYWLGLVEETSKEIQMLQHYVRKRIHRRVREVVTDLKQHLPAYDDKLVAEFSKVIAVNSVLKRGSVTNSPRSRAASTQGYGAVSSQEMQDILPTPTPTSTPVFTTSSVSASVSAPSRTSLEDAMSAAVLNSLALESGEETPIIASTSAAYDSSEKETERARPASMTSRSNKSNGSKSMYSSSCRSEASLMSYQNMESIESGRSTRPVSCNVPRARRLSLARSNSVKCIQTVSGKEMLRMLTLQESPEKDLHRKEPIKTARRQTVGFMVTSTKEDEMNHSVVVAEQDLSGILDSFRTAQDLETLIPPSPMPRDTPLIVPDYRDMGPINEELLTHVRIAHLEVVRAVYWKLIEEGKLPRNSTSALALLYSIDVGLDTAHTPGLQDWDALQPALTLDSYEWLKYLTTAIDIIPKILYIISRHLWVFFGLPVTPVRPMSPGKRKLENLGFFSLHLENFLESKRQEDGVYILSSFIEAHEQAQLKVPTFLGEVEGIDTPELALVVQESQEIVAQAKKRLEDIDPDILSYNVSKQVARVLLHLQQEMVEKFQEEGILRPRDADLLMGETRRDYIRLERKWLMDLWNWNDVKSHIAAGSTLGGHLERENEVLYDVRVDEHDNIGTGERSKELRIDTSNTMNERNE